MRQLFDTSVLIPALVEAHPFHDRAFRLLGAAHRREFDWFVSQHTIAELYCGLTRLPYHEKMTPRLAQDAIRRNVLAYASVVALSAGDYEAVMGRMAELGLSGPLIYDALIARAAEKAGVDKLFTFNPAHFKMVWPEGADIITEP